ncbi:MAG: hypothetical protein RLO08_11540 [Parvibaculaceae bacterium]
MIHLVSTLSALTCLVVASLLAQAPSFVAPALAADGMDNPRQSPHLEVRARANYRDPQAAYWEGFELKNEGDCEGAIERLQPMAMNGRGYESAQHALGLCLMSLGGLPSESGADFDIEDVRTEEQFQEGRTWVLRAANAGHFQAQRTLLALYAVNLGPDRNAIELGKWLQLYEVNPLRLTLGVVEQNDGLRQHLTRSITKTELLLGKERARNWTPSYWAPPGVRQTF